MSTRGLKRRPHYEEVLNAAHKDQASQQGILGVGLQNFASRAINSPLFQRVQNGIEEKMQGDQRRHVEEQGFQHDVQAMAVDQNVSAHDLRWVVQNLQRPPPVPAPPPQQSEARIDYVRMAAEMDALAQRRAVQAAHQSVAAQATQHMTVATPMTPAQLMIRDHTTASAPAPTPTPAPSGISAVARRTGQSVHEVHSAQQAAAVPVPGLLSIASTRRTVARTRTRPADVARPTNTPYGANSSLAVPMGGFAAVRPPTAPTAPAAPAAPTAPVANAPASNISASIRAIAQRHMLEIAKRHASTRTVTATQRAAIARTRGRGGASFPEGTIQSIGKRKQPARGNSLLAPGATPNTQYFRLDRG